VKLPSLFVSTSMLTVALAGMPTRSEAVTSTVGPRLVVLAGMAATAAGGVVSTVTRNARVGSLVTPLSVCVAVKA
jgi:hypothetical protein